MVEAKIIADSLGTGDLPQRLTTIQIKYHRFVLAEFNTHRMFSRNTSSSRAIPVKTLMKRMNENPAIPVKWGINTKGMQAAEFYTDPEDIAALEADWLELRDIVQAFVQERFLDKWNLHKQIANRPLESWMYTYQVVTATEWDNFMNLRCHPDAQPEINAIATEMRRVLEASEPEILEPCDWHLPYVEEEDVMAAWDLITHEPDDCELQVLQLLQKVSTARCARVSYKTHDGQTPSFESDVKLHDMLLASGHMSPFEHAAKWIDSPNMYGNFRGFKQYRKFLPGEAVFTGN